MRNLARNAFETVCVLHSMNRPANLFHRSAPIFRHFRVASDSHHERKGPMHHKLSRRRFLSAIGVSTIGLCTVGATLAACVPIQAPAPPAAQAAVAAKSDPLPKVEDFIDKINKAGLITGVVLISQDG